MKPHTTQIFKGRKLTRTVVKNNILRIWEQTTTEDRYDWYDEAGIYALLLTDFLDYQEPVQTRLNKAVGVIAALSPVKTWSQNKQCAFDMVSTGDCGHMEQFKKKAREIIASDGSDETILSILNGRKISSFYLNIRYPERSEYITIDRHALSIALNEWITDEDYKGMTANQYEFFMQCYVLAAAKVNVTPLLMQSATWVRWRKIKQNYR